LFWIGVPLISKRALHLSEFKAESIFVPDVFLRRCPSSTTRRPMFVDCEKNALFIRNRSYEMISTAMDKYKMVLEVLQDMEIFGGTC